MLCPISTISKRFVLKAKVKMSIIEYPVIVYGTVTSVAYGIFIR